MRMPGENVARRRLFSTWGRYLQARLAIHTATKALHGTWSGLQKALQSALAEVDGGWEQRITARAALEWWDIQLDNAVRRVAALAKADLGGTTEKPDYKLVFKKLPGEVVVLPFRKEIDEVKLIEKALEGATWKSAKTALPELKAAREGLEKALAAYEAARLAHRHSEDQLDDAEMNWRHSYRATYGAIVEKFPADKRVQESFFWRGQDREEAASEEETPAPTPL